jgi:hypothetical protein
MRAASSAFVGLRREAAAAHEQDRRLLRRDAGRAQEPLRLLVVLEVEPVIRDAVAREELTQALRVAREPRADQAMPGAQPDQDRPPLEERAEDDVRELLVVADDATQPAGRDLDHGAGVPDDGGERNGSSGEQVQLAEEAVRPVDGDDAILGAVVVDDRDDALLDDEEVAPLVPRAEEHVARPRLADPADRAQPAALLVVQPRERAVAVDGLLEPRSEPAHASSGDGGIRDSPFTPSTTNATSST